MQCMPAYDLCLTWYWPYDRDFACLIEDACVALTAVNPAPVLVKGATAYLTGKAMSEEVAQAVGDLAAKTAKPLTTSALTPEYRREMIRVFTKRAVLAAAAN